ncbi:hypothetical protein D3C76_1727110 [compost metagenome]
MRIDLRLQSFKLRLFPLEPLNINTVDQLLDIPRHHVKRFGDMHKFIIARKGDPFLKVALLERTDQPDDTGHLSA